MRRHRSFGKAALLACAAVTAPGGRSPWFFFYSGLAIHALPLFGIAVVCGGVLQHLGCTGSVTRGGTLSFACGVAGIIQRLTVPSLGVTELSCIPDRMQPSQVLLVALQGLILLALGGVWLLCVAATGHCSAPLRMTHPLLLRSASLRIPPALLRSNGISKQETGIVSWGMPLAGALALLSPITAASAACLAISAAACGGAGGVALIIALLSTCTSSAVLWTSAHWSPSKANGTARFSGRVDAILQVATDVGAAFAAVAVRSSGRPAVLWALLLLCVPMTHAVLLLTFPSHVSPQRSRPALKLPWQPLVPHLCAEPPGSPTRPQCCSLCLCCSSTGFFSRKML